MNVYPHREGHVVHRPVPGRPLPCAPSVPSRTFVLKEYVDRLIAELREEIGSIALDGAFVPLVMDSDGGLTAATVGTRSAAPGHGAGVASFATGKTNIASGDSSFAQGTSCVAKGLNSVSLGCTTQAAGNCALASGKFSSADGAYATALGWRASALHDRSFVWNGVDGNDAHFSPAAGTFSANPAGGMLGFYVGSRSLSEIAGYSFLELIPEALSSNVLTVYPANGTANHVSAKVEGLVPSVKWHLHIDYTGTTSAGTRVNGAIDRYVTGYGTSDQDFAVNVVGDVHEVCYLGIEEGNVRVETACRPCEIIDGVLWPDSVTVVSTDSGFTVDDATGFVEPARVDPEFTLHVAMPDADPPGTRRKFTLALVTDATEGIPVVWDGITVVEAFPGASALAAGTTVWDVSEVSPGTFRIDRSPAPAGLLLTSPSGRKARLTLCDDLTLNVTEVI